MENTAKSEAAGTLPVTLVIALLSDVSTGLAQSFVKIPSLDSLRIRHIMQQPNSSQPLPKSAEHKTDAASQQLVWSTMEGHLVEEMHYLTGEQEVASSSPTLCCNWSILFFTIQSSYSFALTLRLLSESTHAQEKPSLWKMVQGPTVAIKLPSL